MRRGKLTGRNIRATPAVAQVDGVLVDGHFSRPYRLRDVAVERIVKKLRIKDSLTAEEGYHDAVRTMARKPYPALEGMRNVRRLLKTQNPRIGEAMSRIWSTTATFASQVPPAKPEAWRLLAPQRGLSANGKDKILRAPIL